MGGPSSQEKKAQRDTSQQQLQIGQQYAGMAKSELNRMNELQQPTVDFYSGIIKAAQGGDYGGLITAAGPTVSNITQQAENAKENIYNTVPAGAGRDYALAAAKSGTAGNISGTLNQLFLSAFPQLSQIGGQAGQVGLNEAGAALSGLSGGAQTNQAMMNQEAQQKASTMGFFGSLAGAAGAAAGGGAFGSL